MPDDAELIFGGEAIDVHVPLYRRHAPTTRVEGLARITWRLWFDALRWVDRDARTTFRVTRVWRGQVSQFVTVNHGAGVCGLGASFEEGKEYFVYAAQTDGEPYVGSCGGIAFSEMALPSDELAKLGTSRAPSAGRAPLPLFWRDLLLPGAITLPLALAALIAAWHSKTRSRAS